jgi:carbohydrate esterase-like sialic acid-specific acetylesterase
MKTFLSSGQSNALWYGDGGYWPQTWNDVTAWNCENNRSDLENIGSSFVAPVYGAKPFREKLLDGTLATANNASIHACQTIARVLGEPVRLIIVAKDGAPIQDWCDGTIRGPLYQRIQAVLSGAGVLSVDGMFWHQGEANEADYTTYATKFGAMLNFVHQDGFLSSSAPVVIGTPTYDSPNISSILRSIGNSGGRYALAEMSHLQLKSGDVRHYSGPSAFVAGRIIANSYLSVL